MKMYMSENNISLSDEDHIKNGDTIHFIDGVVRCRICGVNEKMKKWPIGLDTIELMTDFIESFAEKHIKCIAPK